MGKLLLTTVLLAAIACAPVAATSETAAPVASDAPQVEPTRAKGTLTLAEKAEIRAEKFPDLPPLSGSDLEALEQRIAELEQLEQRIEQLEQELARSGPSNIVWTAEQCVAAMKGYFTQDVWDFAKHWEQVCEDEAFFQSLPLKDQLVATRILLAVRGDKAIGRAIWGHCHYENTLYSSPGDRFRTDRGTDFSC